MKVLVTGAAPRRYDPASPTWTDKERVKEVLRHVGATIVVHGAARGADRLAGEAARELGLEVRAYPADWATHHRAAGPIRNREMLTEHPDLVIAFHPDIAKSTGTVDMLMLADKAGIPYCVVEE